MTEPATVTTDQYELADLIRRTAHENTGALRAKLIEQIGATDAEELWTAALEEIDRCDAAEFSLNRFGEQLSAAENAVGEAGDALAQLRTGLGSHMEYSGRTGKDLAALLDQAGVLLRAAQAMNPVEAN